MGQLQTLVVTISKLPLGIIKHLYQIYLLHSAAYDCLYYVIGYMYTGLDKKYTSSIWKNTLDILQGDKNICNEICGA